MGLEALICKKYMFDSILIETGYYIILVKLKYIKGL